VHKKQGIHAHFIVHFKVSQRYVPIELLTVTISVSRRMIPFSSGSCLSKLDRVKTNSNEMVKIIDDYHIPTM